MDYQQKYLKYKNKYLNLKGILQGGEKIFDFDKFLKSDETYDIEQLINLISINKISEECLNDIKDHLQIFYKKLYEKLTGTTSETIYIPTYFNDTYKVNYYEQYKYYNIFFKEYLKEISLYNYDFIRVIKRKLIGIGNGISRINNICVENNMKIIFLESIVPFLKNLTDPNKDFDFLKLEFFFDFADKYFENVNDKIQILNNEDINKIFEQILGSMIKLNKYIQLLNISINNSIGLSIQELFKDLTEEEVNKIIEEKKALFIQNVLEKFAKSEYNSKVINIVLEYIKNNNPEIIDKDNYEREYHQNVIILNKTNYKDKLCIIGQRIEPHRHSITYCRNSVRKEIRSIFNNFQNNPFYYVDYYMRGHYGLQASENVIINPKYLTKIFGEGKFNFIDEINILNKEGGYCTSWCAYITSLILLNKDKSIKNISDYLLSFNIDSKDNETVIDSQIKEFSELKQKYEENKTDENKYNLKKFYEYINKYYINAIPGHAKSYDYLFLKNMKLYLFIMYFYKTLDKNITDLYKNIISYDDIQNLDKSIGYINLEEINKLIEINKTLKINIDDNTTKIDDKHFCLDEMFTHNDLCNVKELCKVVPREHVCFTKTNELGEICLKGMTGKKKPTSITELEDIKKTREFFNNIEIYIATI